jgi:N-acetylglutamate synthase-like GNAT family acetyltransferase
VSTPAVIGFRGRASRARSIPSVYDIDQTGIDVEPIVRSACDDDVDGIHRLVCEHVADGRLLPRSREEIARRIARFVVAADEGRIIGCADLAPLSGQVGEVRSLVVGNGARSRGIGQRLVQELERRAAAAGFQSLAAFTHTPGYFVKLGFSIVPHTWIPEKIEADCRTCVLFRTCGQYAVMLPLFRTQAASVPVDSAHA